jgi:hypothetical protein
LPTVASAFWSKIKVKVMPDTSKHERLSRTPAEQEVLGARRADSAALAKLFEEWMQGDAMEQRETFEALRRSLDEGRPAGYKLFP